MHPQSTPAKRSKICDFLTFQSGLNCNILTRILRFSLFHCIANKSAKQSKKHLFLLPQGTQNHKKIKKSEHSKKRQKHNAIKSGSIDAKWLQKWTPVSFPNRTQNHNSPKNPKNGPKGSPRASKMIKNRDSDHPKSRKSTANCLLFSFRT